MNSAILIKKKGDTTFRTFSEVHGAVSPAIFMNCVISGNDQVLLRSPGGGGYGPPEKREPESVLRDVQQGFISPQAAQAFYKLAVRETVTNGDRTKAPSSCEIDWETTRSLRRA
jgi:N-methylhydantoinase B/oxoprolinase/acetone carboxylase alpha subunit